MKTITIDDSIWRELTKAKYDLNLHTISEVIERLFKIARKIEKIENEK